jgi:DNA invertase Pin-like site-specific DNA recombinase
MQIDALHAAGVQHIRQEKCSSVGARPELRKVLDDLKAGDVLVVYKMDRIARSLKDLLSIIDKVSHAGASIRSLTEPLDTTGPIGLFIVQVLGAVAQLERSIIRERVIAGQVAAISRGKHHGRPCILNKDQQMQLLSAWSSRETTKANKTSLARSFGVGRHVVDRVIRLHLDPSDSKYGPRRPVLGQYLPIQKAVHHAV